MIAIAVVLFLVGGIWSIDRSVSWQPVRQPQPPSLLVTKVRPAYSGQKTHGLASLCLSNGNEGVVLFQPGLNNFPGIAWMWLGVEKKREGAWSLESESPSFNSTLSNIFLKRLGFDRWSSGRVSEFQMHVPADGEPRRFVVRWKTAPKKLPAAFAWVRDAWNKFRPPTSSRYLELRSAEVVVEKLSDYDYEAAFKRLDGDEYKPGQLSITRFQGFSVGYSDGREASQILSHENKSP